MESANSSAEQHLTVASYNLYWWHVSQFNNWEGLFERLRSHAPFDIVGFQECDDVVSVLHNIGLARWAEAKAYNVAAAPIAWDPQVFRLLEGPGHVEVSSD